MPEKGDLYERERSRLWREWDELMGYMRHHGMLVTGWKDEHIERAHALALECFTNEAAIVGAPLESLVSPLIAGMTNGYRSFAIVPDGSKEWWDTSDAGDRARAAFIERLRTEELWVDWVEVQFGDDEDDTRITAADDIDPPSPSAAKDTPQ